MIFGNSETTLTRTRGLRNGSIVPMVALVLPVLLIVCAMAINLAHLQLVKTELQVATDAAVRAASRVYNQTGNLPTAVAEAQRLSEINLVNHQSFPFQIEDFETGISVRASLANRYDFTPSQGGTANALRLNTRKSNDSPAGPVQLLFPFLTNISTANLRAQAIATQTEMDVVLVIDRSGSMAYAANEIASPYAYPINAPIDWEFGDPAPPLSRWLDTVAATQIFLQELNASPQQERVGLITYGTNATFEHDLTGNHSLIMQGLDQYTQSFPAGATNIGEGLNLAGNMLATSPAARPFASKIILLMTDGIHNWGPSPESVADALASVGVMIFTVTFSQEANQFSMQQVAQKANGKHFHASTGQDLQNVFQEIARTLPVIIAQ